MKRLLSEELIAIKYKEYQDGKRAQEVADELGYSVQHILRSFRKHEGLPCWTKKHKTVMLGDHKNPKLLYYPKPYRNHEEDTK